MCTARPGGQGANTGGGLRKGSDVLPPPPPFQVDPSGKSARHPVADGEGGTRRSCSSLGSVDSDQLVHVLLVHNNEVMEEKVKEAEGNRHFSTGAVK